MRTLLTILAVGSLAARTAEDTSGLLQHVKFQSSNFENILTWDGEPAGTPGTVYSVEYKRYGEKAWLAKAGCQRITQKSCNLTMETRNHTEFYYAKVTAFSPGGPPVTKMTDRFSSWQHRCKARHLFPCWRILEKIQFLPSLESGSYRWHLTRMLPCEYGPSSRGFGGEARCKSSFSKDDGGTKMNVPVDRNQTRDEAGSMRRLCVHGYLCACVCPCVSVCVRVCLSVSVQSSWVLCPFQHLEGKQREYEFLGLTPDTEFLGSIMISVPLWSKKSAPYVCRVKTLPDRTWAYSFSGAVLFSTGFLIGLLCYLGYKYVTKPPVPPNSLNVQRVLTFQPLRFIQEHVLIPVLDLSGPHGLAQPIQYSQVVVSGPREPPRAAQRHSLPDVSYVGQSDVSLLPTNVPPQQTLSPPSYAPKAVSEVQPPSYAPQVASDAKTLVYSPQQVMKTRPLTYSPQGILDSWPASYAVCVEDPGKDCTAEVLSNPKQLKPKGQLQEDTLAGSCLSGDLSLQEVTSLAEEGAQRPKSLPLPLGFCMDRRPDLHALHSGEPETPRYLKEPLSLLSSVQIEGHPVSLPLNTHSLSCSSLDQEPSPWSLLDSLVCPRDEGPGAEAVSPSSPASELQQSTELDCLFKGLALTVQWES
ncbi:interleukin-22 receptor subunit alpha-1 [Psammomys obesus]|uniref:interleukin-22 receptor subunit alpha-1 n=1 Tax=Psammomys obesus TaxID=48139 RepID=UPI002452A1E5|nr:interleukin-22 receptor subunit alpha-1 [Psammomys obesus]